MKNTAQLKRPDKLGFNLGQRLLSALCAGDAIGATSEFASYDRAVNAAPAPWPFRPVGGGPFGWKPGEPTDDGQQAIVLARSIIEGFEPLAFLRGLQDWRKSGPRDIGSMTRQVLALPDRDCAVYPARKVWEDGGKRNAPNGALSRNGIVAGYFHNNITEAYRVSLLQTIVTHYHPMCVLTCAVQTWITWTALNRQTIDSPEHEDWGELFWSGWVNWITNCEDPMVKGWLNVVSKGSAQVPAEGEDDTSDCSPLDVARTELFAALSKCHTFRPKAFVMKEGRGFGYTLSSLQMAIWAWLLAHGVVPNVRTLQRLTNVLPKNKPELAVSALALYGRDSDTYCAIAAPMIAAMSAEECGLCCFDEVNAYCTMDVGHGEIV